MYRMEDALWMRVRDLHATCYSAGDETRYYADGVVTYPNGTTAERTHEHIDRTQYLWLSRRMTDGAEPFLRLG